MKKLILLLSLLAPGIHALEYISLEREKSAYLPYEPVNIQVLYHGSELQELSLANDDIRLTVKHKETDQKRVFRHFIEACFPPNGEMKERDLSAVFQISADQGRWLCEKPGNYQAWITLASGVVSNVLEFQVMAPTDQRDKDAAGKIALCNGFQRFHFLEGGDMFADALALSKELAEGNSAYRKIMRELLLKNYCQRSVANGEPREINFDLAMKYRDQGDASQGRRFGKLQKLWLLKRAALHSGRSPEAYGIEKEAELLFQDSPGLRENRSMRNLMKR